MARERQSAGGRFQKRHSGEWRSQGGRRKANGNGSREMRRERKALRAGLLSGLEAPSAAGWWLMATTSNSSRERRRERWALRAGLFVGVWRADPLEGVAGCWVSLELAREERSLVAALCRDDSERLEAGAGG